MGQGMMVQGQMPQMMDQMGQGKMGPEDQKKNDRHDEIMPHDEDDAATVKTRKPKK